MRPTNDADTVIDVRADPTMSATFTGVLTDLGFASAGISAEGLQHRWVRGDASIDVLLPDGIGERARLRQGVTGSPTLPTAGGTQALLRSETAAVAVAGREGSVRRPNLVGALVGKAAALSNTGDPGLGRHRRDFLILAGLLTARDFRSEEITKKDRQRLRTMVERRKDRALLLQVTGAEDSSIGCDGGGVVAMPEDFVIARNTELGSTLRDLLRIPLGDGIILKAKDTWPRTGKVYCHRVEEWPVDAEVVERVVSGAAYDGAAIDLVLDRGRENRSQIIITNARGRQMIFWQTARTAKQARPAVSVPAPARVESRTWRSRSTSASGTRSPSPTGRRRPAASRSKPVTTDSSSTAFFRRAWNASR